MSRILNEEFVEMGSGRSMALRALPMNLEVPGSNPASGNKSGKLGVRLAKV